MAVSSSLTSEIKATPPEQVMAAIAAVDRLRVVLGPQVRDDREHPSGRSPASGAHDRVDHRHHRRAGRRLRVERRRIDVVDARREQPAEAAGRRVHPHTVGRRTRVEFSLTVDPKIPLPGFLVKKAQKMAVETASKGLAGFVAKTV